MFNICISNLHATLILNGSNLYSTDSSDKPFTVKIIYVYLAFSYRKDRCSNILECLSKIQLSNSAYLSNGQTDKQTDNNCDLVL